MDSDDEYEGYDSEEERMLEEQFLLDNESSVPANDEEEEDNDVPRPVALTPIDLGRKLWNEVCRIQCMVGEKYPEVNDMLETFNEMDMLLLATHFACQFKQFQKEGKSTAIDIGYHYTKSENMATISTTGLLSKPEREKREVKSHYNGSANGEGIYTADDCLSTTNYGDVGLIVARLLGVESTGHGSEDTFVRHGVKVLRNSAQCCVLMQYKTKVVLQRHSTDDFDYKRKQEAVGMAHQELLKLVQRHWS